MLYYLFLVPSARLLQTQYSIIIIVFLFVYVYIYNIFVYIL